MTLPPAHFSTSAIRLNPSDGGDSLDSTKSVLHTNDVKAERGLESQTRLKLHIAISPPITSPEVSPLSHCSSRSPSPSPSSPTSSDDTTLNIDLPETPSQVLSAFDTSSTIRTDERTGIAESNNVGDSFAMPTRRITPPLPNIGVKTNLASDSLSPSTLRTTSTMSDSPMRNFSSFSPTLTSPTSPIQIGSPVVFEISGVRVEGLVEDMILRDLCHVQISGTARTITVPTRNLRSLTGRYC